MWSHTIEVLCDMKFLSNREFDFKCDRKDELEMSALE